MLSALLGGCATAAKSSLRQPQSTIAPVAPVEPDKSVLVVTATTDRSEGAAVIAPLPRKQTWRFLKPAGHKIVWWETSTNLMHWQFDGWTTNDTITVALTNAQQFYRFASVPWSNSFRIAGGTNQVQPPDFFQP